MEEVWRGTAWEAMCQNLTDNTMRAGAFQAIEVAHSHLARAADVCGSYRRELPYQPAGAGDALPHLPDAMEHLGIAISCARQLSASHDGSGHVFSLCTARIGLQDSAPLTWQRWAGHHADAADHAAMALQRLQSAWSHGAAGSDAVFVMLKMAPFRMSGVGLLGLAGPHAAHQLLDHHYQHNLAMALRVAVAHAGLTVVPPQGFPLWDAWGHAAEQLLRRAADDLAMARAALENMRRAIIAQFFEACWMLKRRVAS
ncbi:hypothetical protein ACQ4PT_059718 [Festuca glaucescens]